MKLADSHLHLFRQGFAARYGTAWANSKEPEIYEAIRRVHGIERGLIVGYEGDRKFSGNNRYLAKLVKKLSWISPVAFAPLASPPSPKVLAARHRQGFVGISMYVLAAKDVQPLEDWPAAVFQWLNEHRQIVSINARPESLARLSPFLSKLDQCQILISHLGLPGRHAAPPPRDVARQALQPLRALVGLPQVGVKLSGFYAISDPSYAYPHLSAHPFIHQLYDDFGPQRLYWGSDFSPALEHVSFSQTIDVLFQLGWSAADLQSIMHDNLMRAIRR